MFLAAALIVFAMCGAAAAQTPPSSAFVTGGVFAAIENVSRTQLISPQQVDPDLSATVMGGVVGGGAVFNDRWIVEAEFAVPRSHEATFLVRSLPPPTPLPFPPPVVTQTTTQERRTRGGSVLAGVRTAERLRTRAAFLVGLTFMQERLHTRSVTQFSPPVPFPPLPSESISYAYRTAPTFGADVDIAVTHRTAVVPQLRVIAATSGIAQPTSAVSVRPGVGVRVLF